MQYQKGPSAQAGVALIITFLVMTIILAMVLSISTIVFNEIQIITSIGNSTQSLYAANTGIEQTLYYDRKEIPNGDARGLCNIVLNTNTCNCVAGESCYNCTKTGTGCAPNSCTSCTVNYSASLSATKTYSVSATVSMVNNIPNINISSNGCINGTSPTCANGVARTVSFTASGSGF